MIPRDYVDEVISTLFDDAVDPRIVVVGCGGAGSNVVSALYNRSLQGVETVAVNTDPSGLTKTQADVKILLEPPEADDRVDAAGRSAKDASDTLRDALTADIAFIVAGLGGAAGTGVAPVVAELAKEVGAVSIGLAILPFPIEGRDDVAQRGLAALKAAADTVVILDNGSLMAVADDLSFRDALSLVDRMVTTLIEGVLDHLSRSFLLTLAEEVESVAREIERSETEPRLEIQVATPTVVEAATEINPVAFDDTGFIGFR